MGAIKRGIRNKDVLEATVDELRKNNIPFDVSQGQNHIYLRFSVNGHPFKQPVSVGGKSYVKGARAEIRRKIKQAGGIPV